jgi:hypothetical protein
VLESELSAVFTDQGPSIAAGILFDPLRAAPDGAAEIHLCSIGFVIGIDGRAVDHSEHCGRPLEGLATKVPAAEKASLIRIILIHGNFHRSPASMTTLRPKERAAGCKFIDRWRTVQPYP